MTNNALKNRRIEFHILQSFPVTCLNRDDVGSPKSAIVGGVNRARISSQCWKRQVRLVLHDLGIKLGMRTKYIDRQVKDACLSLGAEETAAIFFSKVITRLLAEDTLLFISEKEVKKFAEYAKGYSFDVREIIKPLISKANKKNFAEHIKKHSSDTNEIIKFILSDTEKEVFKENPEGYSLDKSKIDSKEAKKEVKKLTKFINRTIDVLDVALFGRMVANAANMNIEAAASFSHALSIHKVTSEIDFFTALDDFQEEPGSAHMGSLEFNSATYYRYISLDLGQLAQTLRYDGEQASAEQIKQVIEVFTKALFIAVPSARQTTQSGASPWEFAKVLVRQGQRLQVSFEKPVKAEKEGGYLAPGKDYLQKYFKEKEQMFGSLFGKLDDSDKSGESNKSGGSNKSGDYEWGENKEYSVDQLIQDLQQHVE